jgi:hypothetical protein
MTPEQKQLLDILDFAFPLTKEIRTCRLKKMKWQAQRMQLTEFVEAYRQGSAFRTSPLLISIDLEKVKQMINN